MTDRELLGNAAKAAGIKLVWKGEISFLFTGLCSDEIWNPLLNDGDALRLAVKLKLNISVGEHSSWAGVDTPAGAEHNNDPYAATRRVIVRAAAEIGRSMK